MLPVEGTQFSCNRKKAKNAHTHSNALKQWNYYNFTLSICGIWQKSARFGKQSMRAGARVTENGSGREQ